MNTMLIWIRRWPLITFFILSNVISWGTWLPYIFSRKQIFEVLAVIGLFGPALACVFTARLTGLKDAASARGGYPWCQFILAWIATTFIFVLYSRPWLSGTPIFAHVIFAIFGIAPAYVIAAAFSSHPTVKKTLSSLIRPRGWWGWYLIALLLPPIMQRFTGAAVSRKLGLGLLSHPFVPTNLQTLAGSIVTIFLYTFIYAGGVDEEVGLDRIRAAEVAGAIQSFDRQYHPLVFLDTLACSPSSCRFIRTEPACIDRHILCPLYIYLALYPFFRWYFDGSVISHICQRCLPIYCQYVR